MEIASRSNGYPTRPRHAEASLLVQSIGACSLQTSTEAPLDISVAVVGYREDSEAWKKCLHSLQKQEAPPKAIIGVVDGQDEPDKVCVFLMPNTYTLTNCWRCSPWLRTSAAPFLRVKSSLLTFQNFCPSSTLLRIGPISPLNFTVKPGKQRPHVSSAPSATSDSLANMPLSKLLGKLFTTSWTNGTKNSRLTIIRLSVSVSLTVTKE